MFKYRIRLILTHIYQKNTFVIVNFPISKNQPHAHSKWLREQIPLGCMVPHAAVHTCRLFRWPKHSAQSYSISIILVFVLLTGFRRVPWLVFTRLSGRVGVRVLEFDKTSRVSSSNKLRCPFSSGSVDIHRRIVSGFRRLTKPRWTDWATRR